MLVVIVSTIRETTEDNTMLYGIEIELTAPNLLSRPEKVFFWAHAQPDAISGYEKAALQAIRYLQSIYGFLVSDYSFEGMVVYRKFMEAIATATPAQKCLLVFSYKEAERGLVFLMLLTCCLFCGMSQRGTILCDFLFF